MQASILFGAGWENDSVEVLWRDAGRVFCRLRRNDAEGEKHAFIPVPAGAEHPTMESVNRLTHEHELKSYLDSAWALRPLELVRERGQTMLVVNYTGGEPHSSQTLRIAGAASCEDGDGHTGKKTDEHRPVPRRGPANIASQT
jgi:hypothetical protein